MRGNWIKISRGIRKSWIWEEPKYLKWWIDLIMLAGYEDKRIRCGNEIVVLERGSFVTSQVKLAERWNVNRETVKRYLDLLKADNMIDYTTSNRKTIVKVLNYSVYQDCGESDPATNPATKQAPNPATNPATNPAQHKKGKKEKNIYILAPGAGARVIPPTLEDVKSYCKENNLVVNPEEFFKTYAPDWMKGDEPIRDWQGLVRGWHRKALRERDKPVSGSKNRFRNFDEREHDDAYYDDLEQALLRK